MKKALVLLLILIIAVSLFMFTGCKNQDEKGKLYVYTESGFPPFEYPSGNDIVGVDIEIAKTIADRLGMELVVKDVNFEAILAALTDDNAIGLAGLTITPDREEEVDFSIPYFEAVQYVVYKEGTLTLDENSMVSGAQLKNKVIGTQSGTTGDIIADEESAEGGLFEGATVKGYDNALIAAQDIGNGCEVVVIDRHTALQIEANNPNLNLKANQIAQLDSESYGIAVKKANKKLLYAINWILQELIEEGKIVEWFNEHSVSPAEEE